MKAYRLKGTASYGVSLGLCIFTAWIWTLALLYSQNILYFNSFWTPSSYHFQLPQDYTDRDAVAGFRLRTQSSKGRRIVVSRNAFDLKKIEFQFYLKERSYLDLIINMNGPYYTGIRLSQDSDQASIIYEADSSGRFLSRKEIPPIKLSSWLSHRAELVQVASEQFILAIDERAVGRFAGKFAPGKFGFEVTPGAEVLNVTYLTKNNMIENRDFQSDHALAIFLTPHLSIALLFWLILQIVMRRKNEYITRVFLFTSLLGILWFSFDFLTYSKKSFLWDLSDKKIKPMLAENTIFNYEGFRHQVFRFWFEALGGSLPSSSEIYQYHLRKGEVGDCHNGKCVFEPNASTMGSHFSRPTFRFMLIGASLGAGYGTTDLNDSYYVNFHRSLYKSLKKNYDVASKYTQLSKSNYRKMDEELDRFKPDYVFVENPNPFWAKATRRWLESKKIKVIMLRRLINPKSLAIDRATLRANHKELERITKEELPPLEIDGNNFLLGEEVFKKGDPWWEKFHLTPYGHRLYGDYLAGETLTLALDCLRKKNKTL